MREENVMQQGRGAVQRLGGRIRQAIGRLFGHERTEVEGRAEELRGQQNVERGMAAERREGAAETIGGTVEKKVGETVGSERMAVEGRAKELEGQVRHETNR